MRKRLALLIGMIVAGCGTAPALQETMTLTMATAEPAKLAFAFPSPRGFGLPVPVALDLGPMPTLKVAPQTILGRSNSHLLGWCRNHVTGHCDNLNGKLVAMRELQPTWGDGKALYRIGHGITDGRSDYAYMTGYHFEQCWNVRDQYPYDDIRGGIEEADAMGADQIHVVNFGTSDPQEAARYVSYLDHVGDANRLRYPSTAAGARLFELGNEIAMKRERGHETWAPDEKVYAARAREFALAMRQAADGPIQIGAVASVNSNWEGDGWSGGADTVKHLIEGMGDQVDFLIFHGYPAWPVVREGDLASVLAQNEWNRKQLEDVIWPAIQATGRPVGIANTEFSTNLYSDPLHARGMFGALFAADSVALAMNQRLLAAAEFCFSHDDHADAGFFYDDDPARPTPIYAFERMLAKHWGDVRVAATATEVPTQTVTGARGQIQLPLLATTAAASQDGSRAYMLVVNRSNDQEVRCRVDFGFPPAGVTAYTLASPLGWDAKDASVTTQAVASLAPYGFQRASVTILEARR
ncbi:MAG: alpha-L-arabinofuranosidase [Cyanobacteria bacterium RYN_339]|nr:alpha-L-arabinofuranosidase [Cyanobacteria bacterium RYN_339]